MVKIKTELEQKIELMDSLKNVKNVVNEAGGSITEDTPYLSYGEKVAEVLSPSVQKGSFDSATQQLTLKYDYLVEMINSSTVTTAEQKSTMIASLNNQSPVINMATDIAVENSYIYGFMATSEIPVGLQVDKATPCTLKIMFDGESIGSLGSFEAIANYMTQLSGETTTPEMVEAMFGSFIVDENLCTISGTLGSFSVEFN